MGIPGTKPVYVLHGTDIFLRDQYRKEVAASVLGEADPQTCINRYDSQTELSAVLDDLRTLPFLGDHRLVILEDADEFVTAHRDALERYLADPSSFGTLLLMVKSFPANTRLAKLVAKVGVIIDCASPGPAGMGKFIREQAKKMGREIERPALELLGQWVGGDQAHAFSELEKLSLYSEGRASITIEDVSAVVVAAGGVNPYALNDALMAGDAKKALNTLEAMLTQRGEEYRTLGLIAWHLRRVLKAKYMRMAGQKDFDIFSALRVHSVGQEPFRRLLARRSLQKICEDFRQLIRADLAIKTGREPKAALQRLVVALC